MLMLKKEIEDAIRKNLPELVGEELQDLLLAGAIAVSRVDAMELEINTLRAGESERARVAAMEPSLSRLGTDLRERENALVVQEAIAKAVREERMRTRDEIYQLARIAFDNPKMKYGASLEMYQDGRSFNAKATGGEFSEASVSRPA